VLYGKKYIFIKDWVDKGVFVLDLLRMAAFIPTMNLSTFLEWIPHLKFITGLLIPFHLNFFKWLDHTAATEHPFVKCPSFYWRFGAFQCQM